MRKPVSKVRLFLTGGDYAADWSKSALPIDEALETAESEIALNGNEVAILLVPSDKTKEEIMEFLDSMKETVEEAMKE